MTISSHLHVVALALLIGALAAGQEPSTAETPASVERWREDFTGKLDRWEVLSVHDARSKQAAPADGALVLSLDTIGTRDETVKLLGVRSRRSFAIPARGAPLRVSVDLDWNQQANGSYLTLGFALVPEPAAPQDPAAERAPHELPLVLAFEWVGVPPGKLARPSLWWRKAGGLRPLYTEGWPQPRREDRKGRLAGRTRVALEASGEALRLLEGDKVLYEGKGTLTGPCRLLLFVTSHSNFPARTVRFHAVDVSVPAAAAEAR